MHGRNPLGRRIQRIHRPRQPGPFEAVQQWRSQARTIDLDDAVGREELIEAGAEMAAAFQHDGPRRGVGKGVRSSMGPSALLKIGGVSVAVISNRQQCMDPMQLELFGIDIAAARTVVLKSLGHFRAGFDEFFTPDRIVEVDCPGLTSPSLHSFEWTRLPRPVYPLDQASS